MKIAVLFACMLTVALAGCSSGGSGGSSPENAVKGAVKCLHDKDYNGYAQYLPLATVYKGIGRSEGITEMKNILFRIEGEMEESFEDEVIEFIHDGRDEMIKRENERFTQFERQTNPSQSDYQIKTVRARVRLRNGKEVNRAWNAIYEDGTWHVIPNRSTAYY